MHGDVPLMERNSHGMKGKQNRRVGRGGYLSFVVVNVHVCKDNLNLVPHASVCTNM